MDYPKQLGVKLKPSTFAYLDGVREKRKKLESKGMEPGYELEYSRAEVVRQILEDAEAKGLDPYEHD